MLTGFRHGLANVVICVGYRIYSVYLGLYIYKRFYQAII